jgi:hypothetical protein
VLRRLALTLLPLVAACSLGATTFDPRRVLDQGATALAAIHSVAVEMKFGPGASYVGLTLVSASGKVRLPTDSDTTFKAQQTKDSLIELRLLTLADGVYVQAPFVGFQKLPASEAERVPSVSRIFDATTGLPALMRQGKQLEAQGEETVSGIDCYKVHASYPSAVVGQAVQAVTPTGDIAATLWIGRSDHLLRKARLDGELYESGKNTYLEVRLHDFNASFDIHNPLT